MNFRYALFIVAGTLGVSGCGPAKPTAHTHSMPAERAHQQEPVRTYASSVFNEPGSGRLDREGREAMTAGRQTAVNGTGYGPLRPNQTQIEPHGEGK
jgi:hypothetical protein